MHTSDRSVKLGHQKGSDGLVEGSIFLHSTVSIGSASDSRASGPEFDTRPGHILSVLLPLVHEGRLSEYWQKYVHLVNRLRDLSLPCAQEKCGLVT